MEEVVVVEALQGAAEIPAGLRGLQEMRPWAKKLVKHQPGKPGGGQPVDDPALSWPARGDDDDAWENCQQELGVGGEDPLGGQRGCGGRQWW